VCLAAAVAVGFDVVWALSATRQARVSAGTDTSDVIAHDAIALRVSIDGPRRLLVVHVGSAASKPMFVDCPGEGRLNGVADARGVLTALNVEVTSFGVAGLVKVTRGHLVGLSRPVWVAPRPATGEPLREAAGVWGERVARAAAAGDAVRSIRPYVRGDPQGRVHWPASARHGHLVVKELDEPAAPRLLMVVDLRPGGTAGEAAASRAAWYALEAMARGYVLTMMTEEPQRPVTAPVGSPRLAGRRLAVAVAAPAGPPVPARWDAGTMLVVTGTGDEWQ
jgi:uncharacterized protein (DUF58 family)